MDIKKKVPQRSYTGIFRKTNRSNKKYLVIDFDNRCGYCDDHDRFIGGRNNYHVEHFAPKEKFPDLKTTYDNLLYSCPFCNIAKSNKWVGQTSLQNVLNNKGFIDPCENEYNEHLYRKNTGEIFYKTPLGKYMYEELNLFLFRHKILYQLDLIMDRIIIIKNEMKNMTISEKKRKRLIELDNILCSNFMTYYIEFCNFN